MTKTLLTSEEAAEFLKVSPCTIRNWKAKSVNREKAGIYDRPIGPKWIVVGERAVRYRLDDLKAYAIAKNLEL